MLRTSSTLKLPMSFKLLLTAMIAITMISVSGCKKDKTIDTRSAAEMYQDAKNYLNGQNWSRAVNAYQTLSTRYPFGRYTEQAQLELAYAYHKGGRPEAALSTADRFIRT